VPLKQGEDYEYICLSNLYYRTLNVLPFIILRGLIFVIFLHLNSLNGYKS